MIQSETLELVKVLSNPDASGAVLILETDVQNIQVEKNDKILSIENITGQVYKISLTGQKESYDITNKIRIECTPYQDEHDYISGNYFIFTEDENNIKNGFVFQIDDFYKKNSSQIISSPSIDPLGFALQTVEGNQSLKIIIYGEDGNSPMLIYSIPITLRVPQGILDFNINAQNISAAINSTGMEFGINGLKIVNGGFQIVKKEQEKEDRLLFFNNGQLEIKGSGSFSGAIMASSGTIANFNIENNMLSTNGLVIQSSYRDENDNIIPSKIQVQNISIGRGAYIEEYIQLGKGYIKNPIHPNNSNNIFIETYNENNQPTFSLTDNGLIKLGVNDNNRIILNGNNSTIMGNNWTISSDFASFSNIEVSGVINTAIFNQNSIQNIGSTMIFQDSAKINKDSSNTLNYFQVENNSLTLNVGDLVQLSNLDNGQPIIVKITSISQSKYYIELADNTGSEERLKELLNNPDTIITVLGVSGDTIFSISASNRFNSKPYIHSNALSLTEIQEQDGEISYQKKLVLGNLNGIQYAESPLSGYGLYCENVYLNGQLVGRAGKQGNYHYAGISTINDIKSSYFNNEDIIFWAGAKTLNPIPDSDDIPFYVTTNGNLYASSGVFKGSLITDATITASSLKAAAIYPLDNNQASLKIFNTNKENGGISFRNKTENQEIETLNLSTLGFTSNGKTFVDLSVANEVTLSSSSLFTNLINIKDQLGINENGVRFFDPKIDIFDFNNYIFELNFGISGFGLIDKTGGKFEYEKSKTTFNIKDADFKINQSIIFGEKMRYQKIIVNDKEVGYDLYIDD